MGQDHIEIYGKNKTFSSKFEILLDFLQNTLRIASWKISREFNFADAENCIISREFNFAEKSKTAKSAKISSFKVESLTFDVFHIMAYGLSVQVYLFICFI